MLLTALFPLSEEFQCNLSAEICETRTENPENRRQYFSTLDTNSVGAFPSS